MLAKKIYAVSILTHILYFCDTKSFTSSRCHSRFCPTCGTKYYIDRTTSMSFKILNVKHRHCVFTITEELRPFFLADRSLLGCLLDMDYLLNEDDEDVFGAEGFYIF